MLKGFGEIKAQLRAMTGDDQWYYSILKKGGYDKSSQITDRKEGVRVYKMMASALGEIKHRKASLEELNDLGASMDKDVFWGIVGNHGFDSQTITEVSTDVLGTTLMELREAAK